MPGNYIGKYVSWYNHRYIKRLEQYYDLVITEKPDFLFYTVFGDNFKKYNNCVKIYFTGEVVAPNFNQCDYAMGFDYINFEDRYHRYPIYFYEVDEKMNDKSNITDDMAKRKFCNFIYTSEATGIGCQIRKEFCQKLSEYKHIDCPGKVLNNMPNEILDKPGETYKESKLRFQKDYKFTIAFENNSYNGYTTEKIAQAFAANTIPIYWGDPEVTRDFNPKAFINCADYNSFDEVIERVKELDNNDEEYLKMLREPAMRESYKFNKQQELDDFLIHIIEKGNKPFNKMPSPIFNEDGFVGKSVRLKYSDILKLKLTECRYNILRKIYFGKKRKRYITKYYDIKEYIKRIKESLK